jgi:hypothetical protein
VGDAERPLLLEEGKPRAETQAIAERLLHLRGRIADDDADVGDAGGDQLLDTVEEHRLVRDRHELLGAGIGERSQPAALATGRDQAFERSSGGHRSL